MDLSSALAGNIILLAEDDFYLAEEGREALEDAGAQVLGPCATASDAFTLLRTSQPDCAILDVSLADGPSFDLARAMIDRDIPVIFVTGYDATSMPADLAHIPQLQKPAPCHRIVTAVRTLCQAPEAKHPAR